MARPPRLVLDTNLLVSGLISPAGTPNHLLRLWQADAFVLLVTPALQEEITEVLARPGIRRHFALTTTEVEQILTRLSLAAEMVQPITSLPLSCRDPKDDMVLAAALGGKADYLVTGDQDLLVLAPDPRLGSLRILTPAACLAQLISREIDDR